MRQFDPLNQAPNTKLATNLQSLQDDLANLENLTTAVGCMTPLRDEKMYTVDYDETSKFDPEDSRALPAEIVPVASSTHGQGKLYTEPDWTKKLIEDGLIDEKELLTRLATSVHAKSPVKSNQLEVASKSPRRSPRKTTKRSAGSTGETVNSKTASKAPSACGSQESFTMTPRASPRKAVGKVPANVRTPEKKSRAPSIASRRTSTSSRTNKEDHHRVMREEKIGLPEGSHPEAVEVELLTNMIQVESKAIGKPES